MSELTEKQKSVKKKALGYVGWATVIYEIYLGVRWLWRRIKGDKNE